MYVSSNLIYDQGVVLNIWRLQLEEFSDRSELLMGTSL